MRKIGFCSGNDRRLGWRVVQEGEALGRKRGNLQLWGGRRDGGEGPNIWSFLLNCPALLQDGRDTDIYWTPHLPNAPGILH